MSLKLFAQIMKVDEARQEVIGRIAQEEPDAAQEIMDYDSSKPLFRAWSEDFHKATGGQSLGNVRAMHGKVAAGKLTDISFDDQQKAVDVVAKIVDAAEWQKCLEGVYTGFSIGGSYAKRWQDGDLMRYTAKPNEVSLVDNPCIKSARFSLVKADGTVEKREFSEKERQAAADSGAAMADGSYPIKNTSDLQNAVKAFGRAKNPKAVKAHIIARAKALKATDELPADWEGSTKKEKTEHQADLHKWAGQEVYDAQTAMNALNSIYYLYVSEMSEVDEAGQGQVADLKEVINRLKSFIVAELMEETDLSLSAKAGGLAKAGARNAKSDLAHIQGIHDHAAALGADCGAKKGEQPIMEKEVQERFEKLELAQEALSKDNAELKTALEKSETEKAALAAENEKLKKEPAPAEGMTKAVPVSKDTDAGNEPEKPLEPIRKADGTIDQEATAFALIKQAQSNPQTLNAVTQVG